MNPRAIVFDSYGTLFNVAPLADRLPECVPDGKAFASLWREKQAQYFLLADASAHDATFSRVTRDALDYAASVYRCNLSEEEVHALVARWNALPAYDDCKSALHDLSRARPLGILTNGTEAGLLEALDREDLEVYFKWVRSAEEVRRFKPSAGVYELACHACRCEHPSEVLYVTGNPWDAAGAALFGFLTCRVMRTDEPDERFGPKPDLVVRDLRELGARLSMRAAA